MGIGDGAVIRPMHRHDLAAEAIAQEIEIGIRVLGEDIGKDGREAFRNQHRASPCR